MASPLKDFGCKADVDVSSAALDLMTGYAQQIKTITRRIKASAPL